MNHYKAELFLKKESKNAEGPFWHPEEKKLYWVDIEKMEVHRCDPVSMKDEVWQMKSRVGCIIPAKNGKIICALHGEVSELDTTTGITRRLFQLESDLPDNRCNDGKADPQGRLWIGTMSIKGEEQKAALYRIDKNLNPEKQAYPLDLSNGLDWSPDQTKFYHIDTPPKKLYVHQFDKSAGTLREKKQLDVFGKIEGSPDGMCCDAEGKLWIALWGGKKVIRIDPNNGELLAEVEVPAINISCCNFGGDDLSTLYITSARQGLSDEELEEYPLSGSIFQCRPGIKGKLVNFADIS